MRDTPNIPNARQLRRNLSPPEAMLWNRLRDRRTNVIFRRQHPIGPYVLDFYGAKARLAVEIDGESHNREIQFERDQRRDRWLFDQGIETLRLPAGEVLRDPDQAADSIWRTAEARL